MDRVVKWVCYNPVMTYATQVRAEMGALAATMRADRLALVLQWRKAGATYAEIGRRLGVTRQQAMRLVRQAEMR